MCWMWEMSDIMHKKWVVSPPHFRNNIPFSILFSINSVASVMVLQPINLVLIYGLPTVSIEAMQG